MRILQISNKGIYPPDGGTLAITNLSKSFIQHGHEVTLFSIETEKHRNSLSVFSPDIQKNIRLQGVSLSTKPRVINAIGNLMFSKLPYIATRYLSPKVASQLELLLKENTFDIIQIEGLYMTLYIPLLKRLSKALISYRSHNIEHEIWKRNSKQGNFFKKIYYNILSKRIKKLEEKVSDEYDVAVPITKKDSEFYNKLNPDTPIHISPFGVDIEKMNQYELSDSDETSLFYIGALDWIPNIIGLKWFIQNVWPAIHKIYPHLHFYIAGRNGDESLKRMFRGSNIQYLGEVDDAYHYISNHSIMVVPLFSGSGMRVKIIEGMYFERAIVATSLACEGIEYKSNENILVANTNKTFINQIEHLIQNKDLIHQLGKNAKETILKNYNNFTIGQDLIDFYKTHLNES